MNISLSIESFPLDSYTIQDMRQLLREFEEDYRGVLQEASWSQPNVRGFAVLAYTEDGRLIGFATSVDIVNLHHYEWSVLVHPEYRRMSIGSALADGIHHGHAQRQAYAQHAAFIENPDAEKFLQSLGYEPDFKEIQMAADALKEMALPEGFAILPFEGPIEELEPLLVSAFDEGILPVIAFNQAEEGREIWVMKKDGELVATATLVQEEGVLWLTAFAVDPSQQRKGYGKAFLLWSRYMAHVQGMEQIMLDVETANDALHVYQKAQFEPVQTIAYWTKQKA
ncbi:GNAT family N-acetyltransferase [Planococcus ruber]|uniref:GNAT family N-acetyltransferase n=1 Tax=Planococcus ruber TaxID=2027871 RepID=UPI001FEFC157|nr:GNAT family N-acetyltransferase [Planococcus ruber]MCJ1908089.1 GNAT family N-acetyltransferase [Planococcus ruber]